MCTQVALLALGGTIAMVPEAAGGAVPKLDAAALLAAVPSLGDIAAITAETLLQLPGAHLQLDNLVQLAALIRDRIAGGARGVVVTQGTDTIEETSFVLDLLLGSEATVVVTGAMRPPLTPGADGPANLLAAARIAASPAAAGRGTMVVLDDCIHAARHVTKGHTSRPSAFHSPAGLLGEVTEGQVRFFASLPARAPLGDPAAGRQAARVAIVPTWLGDDGSLVAAAVDAGFAGIVAQATGGGHVAPAVADALEQASKAVPVVMVTRTGSGTLLRSTYGFVGSELDLGRRGLLFGGALTAPKARLLLALMVMKQVNRAAMQDVIDRFA